MRVFSFSLHDENLVGVLEGKLQVWGSPLGSLTLEHVCIEPPAIGWSQLLFSCPGLSAPRHFCSGKLWFVISMSAYLSNLGRGGQSCDFDSSLIEQKKVVGFQFVHFFCCKDGVRTSRLSTCWTGNWKFSYLNSSGFLSVHPITLFLLLFLITPTPIWESLLRPFTSLFAK